MKGQSSILVQVDKLTSTTGRITRRVDVGAPLYVGGLPQAFRARAGIVCTSTSFIYAFISLQFVYTLSMLNAFWRVIISSCMNTVASLPRRVYVID